MKKMVGVWVLLLGGALLVAPAQSGEAVSHPGRAQRAPVWQPIGPDGGWVRVIAKNPKNARGLFACLSGNRSPIYKSSNSGASWTRIGLVDNLLTDFAVHPSNPNIFYGVTPLSVYKSTDQGKTFTELRLPESELVRLDGNISISPRKPETIYVAGSYRYDNVNQRYCPAVFRSKDGGLTWTIHKLVTDPDEMWYPRVAASPARAGLVFASCLYRKGKWAHTCVFKSTNGGATWTNVAGSLNRSPYALLLHPSDPEKIYVATGVGVYRTSDGGKNWAKQDEPSSWPAENLAMDSENPQVLYSASNYDASTGTVYKSTDGGVRWAASKPRSGLFGASFRIVAEGSSIFAATAAGVFKSANGGQTWKPSHAGMKASDVPAFALAPASPATIYAGIAYYACFKSSNAGGGWIKMGSFAGCGEITKIVGHPTAANTVYLLKQSTESHAVYRSVDGGKTVKSLWSPEGYLQDLIVDRKNPNLLAAAGAAYKGYVSSMAVFLSSNGGATWTTSSVSSQNGSFAYAVARDPANPNILYAGGVSGTWQALVCKSTNNGASWTDITKGIRGTVLDMAVDPVSPRIVYAATSGSVWKSRNGGGSWTEIPVGGVIMHLIINPNNPRELFLGSGYGGVYYSADQGATWQDFSADMEFKYIQCLDMDPAARILYASTYGGGIVKRSF